MRELYLAAYSFAQQVTDPVEMVHQAKEMGFQGLEFLQPLDRGLVSLLETENMKVISSPMCPLNDESAALMHQAGIRYLGGTANFGNREQALRAAEELNQQGESAASFGFKVYYHNHTHEWRQESDGSLMETVLRHTDPSYVCMEMDAGWAICAGIDPAAFVEKYPGRVELMHVKASTGILGPEGVSFMAPNADGTMRLPGPEHPGPTEEMQQAFANIHQVSGPMRECIADYQTIMEAAAANGCQAFILERDDQYAGTPIACIREDIEVLRRFWR